MDNIAIGYTVASLPAGFKLLTVNYYDDYSFPNAPVTFSVVLDGVEQVYYNNTDRKPKGLATGSWVRVLTSSSGTDAEKSHVFYDNRARPVRNHTVNHLGGYTYTDTKLDFLGKALYTVTYHKRLQGSTEIKTREEFTYTDQGRLLTHTHQISMGTNIRPVELIAKNEYDELGQLTVKRVGGPASTPTGLQKVDYSYNIRGWLKGINDVTHLANDIGNPDDLFAFRLNYNTVENSVEGAVEPLYNGNICETFWRTSGDNIPRKYGYVYDNLNRLTEAIYQKPNFNFPASDKITDAYNEEVGYDLNGNIERLLRYGYQDNNNGDYYVIDKLHYYYKNNQLDRVVDASNSIDGFKDGENPDGASKADYFYDSNGNMVIDHNKDIDKITYNHLNLPTRIEFGASGEKQISYLYNALGVKLRKFVEDRTVGPSVELKTEYLGGFQYLQDVLQYFPTGEGYVNVTAGSKFNYVYNYTDHLGNIRLSYTKPSSTSPLKILEENHYYPFGMKHINYGTNKNNYKTDDEGGIYAVLAEVERNNYQYKYNGKEFQDELSLNWYDYGARNYDPAIGRWMNIDPLASNYSSITPYAYAVNNPIYFLDPDGMKIINGDEEKRKEAEKNNTYWQESLAEKAKYLGISVNSSRSEWKKAALAKNGATEWENTQNLRNEANNASETLDKYTKASEKTEAKIKELKEGAPALFEKMDALSTDIYMQSVNNLGGKDGQNVTWFNNSDPKNVSLKSEFGNNSTVIMTVNKPSGTRTTLEVSQHELGHADYIIENTQAYYQWLKENNINTNNHDGHAKGDPSGARAEQFGPKDFKNKKR